MKKYIFLSLIIVLVLQVLCQMTASADQGRVFRLSDRSTISYDQMMKDLEGVSLVFVGETHDSVPHHRLQLDIIKSLRAAKREEAVAFEMFTAESQPDLDKWVAGLLPLADFIEIYYRDWGFPWSLYKDILFYLKENKIPAVGINLPPEITRKVAKSGFASLSEKERGLLPPETGCAVDETYMKFIKKAYSMHGHGGRQFLYFCEAQLLWDQVMARNLLEFLRKHPQKTVVVLTGNGHAWKRGIPERIRTASGKTSLRVLLPEVPGAIEPSNITIEDADYILLK